MGIGGRPQALLLLAASLPLTAWINHLAGMVLPDVLPGGGIVATMALPSFLAIAALFARYGRRDLLRWPRLPAARWRGIVGPGVVWLGLWLAGSALVAAVAGHWIVYARGWPLVTAFILFGPLGEELLFRGLVFDAGRRLWPASPLPAIGVSSAAFSLHHLFIATAPPGLALAQLGFTLALGLLLAVLRQRSGSLWPGWLLHVATNLPAVFG